MRILHNDLKLFPYKIQVFNVHEMPVSCERRRVDLLGQSSRYSHKL